MFLLTFLKKCRHISWAACTVMLYLTIQPLYAGETLLLSKQLSGQKKDTFCPTQTSCKNETQAYKLVSESQSLVPACIRELSTYISSKTASALKWQNLWGKPDDQLLQASHLTEDLQDSIEDIDIAYSDDYSTAEHKQLRLRKLQDQVRKGEISHHMYEQGLIKEQPFTVTNKPEETNLSFTSALNGLVSAFYKATRYAVSHPKQVLVLGLATHILPIAAQTGNEFIIKQDGSTENPAVAVLTDGNIFVTWESTSNSYDIYGKIFSPDGIALVNEFRINQIPTSDLSYPSVSGLTNGNIFVAWKSNDIYGRIFLPDGTTLDNEFRINQISTNGYYPSVSGLTNGNVFVVWQSDYNVYGRIFFSNGTALSNEFPINQISSSGQPSVVSLTNGNLFVVWVGNLAAGNTDIYAQVLLPDGTALGTEFIVNDPLRTSSRLVPSIACLIEGNVLIAWKDDTYDDISGRFFSPEGVALGNEFTINEITTNEQSSPSVASLTNGNVVVTWQGEVSGNDETIDNIYARAFFPDGTAVGSDVSITQFDYDNQNPSATGLTDGNAFIAWENNTGIYGRILLDSELLDSDSWQIPAAIGGSIGAAVLIGSVSAVVAKKYCWSKRTKPHKSDSTDSDLELAEDKTETPSFEENLETPSSSRVISPFHATHVGFTEHPSFVGKLHGHTYEIWKNLSEEEAELLRPLTSMSIPVLSLSEKIEFTLGQGNFGATYAGSNPQTEEIFAIKEVYGRKAVDESLKEGEIVHSLGDYSHIMPLIDYIHFEPSKKNKEPRLLQVMPLAYINGTSFKKMLEHAQNDQREKMVSYSFRQMMLGLDYLHKQGIVHLDIKADNTLYMKNGTLRIADFGRAKQVGDDDQIADMYILGDIRKFSPEIFALIRKCMGGTNDTVVSFSGKGADIWAAGLYIWELLEDNTDNLFSTKRIPLEIRAVTYTYETFEKLVATINDLKGNYSSTLLNLLRQVLTIDPEMRVKASQVIKKLSTSSMRTSERKGAFEELIRLASDKSDSSATNEEQTTQVYPPADPTLYVKKSKNKQQSPTYIPSDLYAKQ